jgi:uncharacterized protein
MSAVEEARPAVDPSDEDAAFRERARAFVGRAARPAWVSPDPVNPAMIRHWCEVLADRNPVYTDEAFAARSVHGGLVAPPTMLDAWVMRGFIPPADPTQAEQGQAAFLQLMQERGFVSIVATNCDQVYHRYLRPGDVITAIRTIDSVSEEKLTALGAGHFFVVKTSYVDQHGEEVGVQTFRMLVYRPANGGDAKPPAEAAASTALRPRPAISEDTAFFWEGAKRGELLIQRCASCGVLRHPPGPACPACDSFEWDTVASTGRGTVHSFVVYHYPVIPPFEAPYVVVLVDLEEGVRLVSNLIEIAPEDVEIGMPVEVRFVDVDEDLTLPMFVRRG